MNMNCEFIDDANQNHHRSYVRSITAILVWHALALTLTGVVCWVVEVVR